MNIFQRIIAAIKTPVVTVETTAKDITVAIKVDADDAIKALDSLSTRVRDFKTDVEDALEAHLQFERTAAAWSELKVKAGVTDITTVADDVSKSIESIPADVAKAI